MATKASAAATYSVRAGLRGRDNPYVILISESHDKWSNGQAIGIKEAYYKLVQLQLKYEIRAVGAITYR